MNFHSRKLMISLLIFSALFSMQYRGLCELSAELSKCPSCPEKKINSLKFALFSQNDELVRFTDLILDNNIILVFWASYCAPCRKEIPLIADIEQRYGKSKKIKLVLINVDKDGKDTGLSALKTLNVPSLCLFDIYQVTLKQYVPSMKIPAVFLINKKSEILFQSTGEGMDSIQRLEYAVQNLK